MVKAKRCGCGCGAEVEREFLPGHDSKLRHNLAAAIREDRKFRIYNKSYDPIEYVKEHNVHGMEGVIAEVHGRGAAARTSKEAARDKSARARTRELEREAAAEVVRAGRGRRDAHR